MLLFRSISVRGQEGQTAFVVLYLDTVDGLNLLLQRHDRV